MKSIRNRNEPRHRRQLKRLHRFALIWKRAMRAEAWEMKHQPNRMEVA